MIVSLTGPESSGKTYLAINIAKANKTSYLPEASRMYHLPTNYSFDDVQQLALAQAEMIDSLRGCSELMIVDSDMIVYEIWFQERFRKLPADWEEMKQLGRVDLHLLCKPDIPWEADPLREHASDRDRLYAIYLKTIQNYHLPFEIIEGNKDVRLSRCLQFIDKKKAAH